MTLAYSYDSASQLTGLIYTLGATALGNLAYSYDNAGRRTAMGGSFARTGLPLAASATAYNVNNQLLNGAMTPPSVTFSMARYEGWKLRPTSA